MVLALTVIVPPGRMPRLDREVPSVSRVVPVKVAGRGAAAAELAELDELEALEVEDDEDAAVPDDDVELPDADCRTCCTMAEIWLLVRVRAA